MAQATEGAFTSPRCKVGFIGAGCVANALACQLAAAGYPVVAIASRRYASALALATQVAGCRAHEQPQAVADVTDLTFITTPDAAIAEVAAAVNWRPGQMVVHTSGAESVAVLEMARRQGALAGSFHPLQSFATAEEAKGELAGCTFALEGEGALLVLLQEMAEALGGRWLHLRPEDKPLYHAAAVLASNYVVALMHGAGLLWRAMGRDEAEAQQALLPLLRGTADNIERVGLPDCLTGPIARGDVATVLKHLRALERSAPDILPVYQALGAETVAIATEKGTIDAHKAAELCQALSGVAELSEAYRR